MAIARELTSNAWILETDSGEKLGILSSNAETNKYILISEDTEIQFDTMEELEIAINERVKIKHRETQATSFKDIDGYPVAHETLLEVEHMEDGRIAYQGSKRRTKRFYAGYWVYPINVGLANEQWFAKISISEDVFENFAKEGINLIGPFKDKVEAHFAAKQRTSEVKSDDK